MVRNLPIVQEIWVRSLSQEDPLEQGLATHSRFLPGKSHGQRSLVGYTVHGVVRSLVDYTVHGVAKSQT